MENNCLPAYIRSSEAEVQETDKCHYCQAIAVYNDLAEVEQNYQIVGVCACHQFQGLSS